MSHLLLLLLIIFVIIIAAIILSANYKSNGGGIKLLTHRANEYSRRSNWSSKIDGGGILLYHNDDSAGINDYIGDLIAVDMPEVQNYASLSISTIDGFVGTYETSDDYNGIYEIALQAVDTLDQRANKLSSIINVLSNPFKYEEDGDGGEDGGLINVISKLNTGVAQQMDENLDAICEKIDISVTLNRIRGCINDIGNRSIDTDERKQAFKDAIVYFKELKVKYNEVIGLVTTLLEHDPNRIFKDYIRQIYNFISDEGNYNQAYKNNIEAIRNVISIAIGIKQDLPGALALDDSDEIDQSGDSKPVALTASYLDLGIFGGPHIPATTPMSAKQLTLAKQNSDSNSDSYSDDSEEEEPVAEEPVADDSEAEEPVATTATPAAPLAPAATTATTATDDGVPAITHETTIYCPIAKHYIKHCTKTTDFNIYQNVGDIYELIEFFCSPNFNAKKFNQTMFGSVGGDYHLFEIYRTLQDPNRTDNLIEVKPENNINQALKLDLGSYKPENMTNIERLGKDKFIIPCQTITVLNQDDIYKDLIVFYAMQYDVNYYAASDEKAFRLNYTDCTNEDMRKAYITALSLVGINPTNCAVSIGGYMAFNTPPGQRHNVRSYYIEILIDAIKSNNKIAKKYVKIGQLVGMCDFKMAMKLNTHKCTNEEFKKLINKYDTEDFTKSIYTDTQLYRTAFNR